MSDIRDLLDILNENDTIEVNDSFDLEIGEELLIETGVVGITKDNDIILEGDDHMINLLSEAGIGLEEIDESNVVKGPWAGIQQKLPLGSEPKGPKAPVVPLPSAPKFQMVNLYKEFVNTPQFKQAARKPMDDDAFMTLASEYLESKMGRVHPRVLGQFAENMLTVHQAHQKQGQMFEVDELDEVTKLAGLNWNDPNVRAHFDKPTIARVASGETEPVDRTDYNTPPAMRDKTLGMTGPEKRRASLIAQGILKATDVEEALDLKDLRAAAKKVAPVAPAQVAPVDNKDKAPATEVPKTKDGKLDLNALRDLVKEEEMDEAKYQGREVPLGKPMAGDVKKSKVYVRKPNGKVVKVNFGDKNMRIKKSNPGRRKNFRARHNCDNPGPRWKARYWSCRAW